MRRRCDRTSDASIATTIHSGGRRCRGSTVALAMARAQFVCVACLVGLSVGCGGQADPFDRVPVEGTVTIDGAPLSRGTIRFIPDESTTGPKVALPVVDGSFRGDRMVGPVAGGHRIEVEPDESDEFPHDGEEVLEQLVEEGKRRRGARAKSPWSTTHTFAAGEPHEAHFDF